MLDIAQRIDAFPDFLSPLGDAAKRYLRFPSALTNNGVMNIGHRPWVAELNYMLMLYPGISEDELAEYAKRFKLRIPESYTSLLFALNGAFCFGMSLYGVPRSMLDRGIVDRSTLQCHDLSRGATEWVHEYRVSKTYFHFGSRGYSRDENVGYFVDGDGRILGARKRGQVVGEWANFTEFLSAELLASESFEEQLHPSKWDK